MANKTDVTTTKDDKSKAPAVLDGYDLDDLIADAGVGSEELAAEDIAIPYLGILQGLSPQVTEGKEGYIEGARASMLFNNVTGDIYEGRKEGLMIVPCYYNKKWNVWMDRDVGGGLVDVHDTAEILQDCEKNEKGQYVLKDNKQMLVFETAYHYVLRLNEEIGEMERMVIGLKSTGLKANRKLNHAITSAKIPGHPTVTAPRFMFAYKLTTFLEEKNGNSWWSPEFKRKKDPVAPHVYAEAKSYYELVKSGDVKIAEEPAVESGGSHDDGNNATPNGKSDTDEIPF